MRIIRSALCLPVFLAIVVAEASESTEPPLDIGSRVELFVDDYLIESMEGVRLKLHSPRSAGKVLSFDQPWEGNTSYYPNVFQDGDRYRMYYRGSEHGDYLMPPDPDPKDHPPIIAYAESRDGIRWERPNLGIFEFEGSRDNNIVWIDKPGDQTITDCMYVFRDVNPAGPESQRYKALGGSSFPLVALVSADGLHWTELQGQKSLITEGLHDNPFDNLTVVFWEPRLNRYVMFFRDAHRGGRESAAGASEFWQPEHQGQHFSRFHRLGGSEVGRLRWNAPGGDVPQWHHPVLPSPSYLSGVSEALRALENAHCRRTPCGSF